MGSILKIRFRVDLDNEAIERIRELIEDNLGVEIKSIDEDWEDKNASITKEMEDYLYNFIVDTNQEHALTRSIQGNDALQEQFEKWFSIEKDKENENN